MVGGTNQLTHFTSLNQKLYQSTKQNLYFDPASIQLTNYNSTKIIS